MTRSSELPAVCDSQVLAMSYKNTDGIRALFKLHALR